MMYLNNWIVDIPFKLDGLKDVAKQLGKLLFIHPWTINLDMITYAQIVNIVINYVLNGLVIILLLKLLVLDSS